MSEDSRAGPTPGAAARRRLFEQIESPTDGRERVVDPATLQAIYAVPRERFVSEEDAACAYHDCPLPIGWGQTISQPYMVAVMTAALGLGPDSRVLEIGTGSGYQAAVLAHITPHVFTIEVVPELAALARRRFAECGLDTIQCRAGDGYLGWPEAAPFDGILLACAAERVPEPLWEQLAPGGRLVMPLGSIWSAQQLTVLHRRTDGTPRKETRFLCRFVPMTGRVRGGGG